MRVLVIAIALSALGGCKKSEPPAPAPSLAPTAAQVKERVRERLKRIDPKLVILSKDEHALEVKLGDWEMEVFLDNTELACQKGEDACAGMIESMAANFEQAYKVRNEKAPPLDPKTVRLIVKPPDWVANVKKLLEKSPPDKRKDNEIVMKPFLADLWLVYVADQPRGMKMLTIGDLRELKLDLDKVDALAKKNLAAAKPELKMVAVPDTEVWANEEGDDYDAAMIVLPQRWKSLADKLGGLVVAIPARNRVIAISPKGNVTALRGMATQFAAEDDHSITDKLFVWSAKGFVPLDK